MAQLAVQYPSGLEDLYGYGGQIMGQRYDLARRSEGINQDQALQSLYENQQKLPLELRQMGLNADTTEAQLPGIKAKSWELDRNKQVREGIPLSVEQKQQLSKIVADTSEEEWKATQAGVKDMMINGRTPQEREQAKIMWGMMPELETMRQTQREMTARQLEVEQQRGQDRIAARQVTAGRVAGTNQLEKALLSGNPLAVAAAYDFKAQNAEDPDEKAFYLAKSKEYRQLAQDAADAKNRNTQPGAPNIGAMGQGKIPVNPPTPPAQAPLTRGAVPTEPPAPKTQYVAGQTYTGKTGTYKYKGGDPADKNNWEKVK